MAKFPRKESDIVALAVSMVTGFADHTDVYPSPPVNPTELGALISDYNNKKEAAAAAEVAARQATTEKDHALEALIDKMEIDLHYAEDTVGNNSPQLQLIGWNGRKPRTPLTPPGQTRLLEVLHQGPGWLTMDWKKPVDGGKVAAYNIQRRQRPEGDWIQISMAVGTEITLHDQGRGTEWEYRVIAVNKAGEGPASNTVMAVL